MVLRDDTIRPRTLKMMWITLPSSVNECVCESKDAILRLPPCGRNERKERMEEAKGRCGLYPQDYFEFTFPSPTVRTTTGSWLKVRCVCELTCWRWWQVLSTNTKYYNNIVPVIHITRTAPCCPSAWSSIIVQRLPISSPTQCERNAKNLNTQWFKGNSNEMSYSLLSSQDISVFQTRVVSSQVLLQVTSS